jgi:ParB family chromosome partitioning protein
MSVEKIPTDEISKNPNNPRQNFNSSKIDELAESVENQGLLQPVLVRPDGDSYELVHGERRLRAVESLERDKITARVKELTDEEALEMSITENLQREDVTEVAEARSYKMLIDEFDITQSEAADRLGKSQGHISNRLGLLELPDRLQRDILHKIFSPWQAKELARAWGEFYLRDLALDFDLTVKEIRQLVNELQNGADAVSIETTLSADALDAFWGVAGDDVNCTASVVGDDGVVERGQPVKFVNGAGQPVTNLHIDEQTEMLLWAAENTDWVDLDTSDYDDPEPIKIHWPGQRIIMGYERLALADDYDYDGDFDVEIIFPADYFGWGVRTRKSTPKAGKMAEVSQ